MIEANEPGAKVTFCYLAYPHCGQRTDRVSPSVARTAERVEAVLSDDERTRADRFVFASDRVGFLLAHALKRRLLEHLGAGPAAELTFETDNNGRPGLVSSAIHRKATAFATFSLSHTTGMVACAAGWSDDADLSLGLDIEWTGREWTGRAVDMQDLADHVLAPAEADWLRSRPTASRDFDFLRLWTMKEAVAKALGLGLLHPFDQFVCNIERQTAHGRGLDDGKPWAVRLLEIGSEHTGTLALRGAATMAVTAWPLSLSDM